MLERAIESDAPLPARLIVCSRYGSLPTVTIAKGPARERIGSPRRRSRSSPGSSSCRRPCCRSRAIRISTITCITANACCRQ